MYLDSFRHLIEIEALKVQNQNDFVQIANQNKRISDMEQRRNKLLARNLEIDSEIHELKLITHQLEIETLEQKLTHKKSQLTMVVNAKEEHALVNEISLMSAELEQKEDHYFLSLELSESLESEKKESLQFIEGSKKSQHEIQIEVDCEVLKFQKQIEGRNLRIEALVPQCNGSLISLYHDLEKKFKPNRPVSYLIDKKCTQCFMLQNSTFKAAVEEGRSFESCPNCGRLLIPETAKIY